MNTLNKKTKPAQGRYSSKYGVMITALILAILITVLLLVRSVISQSNFNYADDIQLNYICMSLETGTDSANRRKVLPRAFSERLNYTILEKTML